MDEVSRGRQCGSLRTSRAGLAVPVMVAAALTIGGEDWSHPVLRSRECEPCHAAANGGTFEQWLASPYSDPEAGVPCQGCHDRRALPNCCGPAATPVPGGGAALGLLPRPATELSVAAVRLRDAAVVEVLVCNRGAGHDLPTGSSGAVLVLVVEAFDSGGAPLRHEAGSVLGGLAGTNSERAGTIYATGRSALPPFATDVTRYRFAAPGTGEVHIEARLLSRRGGPGPQGGPARTRLTARASTVIGGSRRAPPTP
jgi:hypothetical protein